MPAAHTMGLFSTLLKEHMHDKVFSSSHYVCLLAFINGCYSPFASIYLLLFLIVLALNLSLTEIQFTYASKIHLKGVTYRCSLSHLHNVEINFKTSSQRYGTFHYSPPNNTTYNTQCFALSSLMRLGVIWNKGSVDSNTYTDVWEILDRSQII